MNPSVHHAEPAINHRDAAIAYTTHGWPVFPCRPKDKAPLTPHGLHSATIDNAQIMTWWQHWPDANIGIPTGSATFVVIDLDPRHGSAVGVELLEAESCYLPETVESITGSGGRHLLYAPPGVPIRNNTGKLGPGIDVRGDGGYIIAPPSVHANGPRYEWEATSGPDDIPMAQLPAWVVDRLATRPRTAERPVYGAPIPEGQRNATLARFAGVMRRAGMTVGEIEAALRVMNEDRCRPPLANAEVVSIARSISRYAPAAGEDHATVHGDGQSLIPLPLRPYAPYQGYRKRAWHG
jgi:Bifunctional DNA primase/polymerase, N-terminal/Primase C terminal 1 (PriCT-1)